MATPLPALWSSLTLHCTYLICFFFIFTKQYSEAQWLAVLAKCSINPLIRKHQWEGQSQCMYPKEKIEKRLNNTEKTCQLTDELAKSK